MTNYDTPGHDTSGQDNSGQETPGDEPPSRSPDGDLSLTTTLDLIDATTRLGVAARAAVVERLEAALREIDAAGEVRVRIVADAEMTAFHAKHKGDESTTDVLTFDLSGDPEGPLDVDLIVCLDEAERQAAARGHAVEDELVLYALHGVLHCRGFDDIDDDAASRMHSEEDRVLAAIGVGAVFERPELDRAAGGER